MMIEKSASTATMADFFVSPKLLLLSLEVRDGPIDPGIKSFCLVLRAEIKRRMASPGG